MTNPSSDVLERVTVWQRAPYADCPEGEWVLEISGAVNDCSFVARHTEPLTTAREDVAGLPTLYATIERLSAELERKDDALTDIRNRILCPAGPEPSLEQLADIASAALTLPPTNNERSQTV